MMILFQNLKQVLRVLNKDRFHSLMNIFGLAIGLCCCLLVLLFVQNELEFDTFFPNAERIYRYGVNMTIGNVNSTQAGCNVAVGPLLQQEMPEIEAFVRLINPGNVLVQAGEKTFYENNLRMTDNSIFQVFSLPFIWGSGEQALEKPNTIVLTQKLSNKYFGNENPVGQELIIDNQDIVKITGVVEDFPDNSSLQFDAMLSLDSVLQQFDSDEIYSPRSIFGGMSYHLFFLFAPDFTAEQFHQKFQSFYQRELAEYDQIQYVSVIESIKNIHLRSQITRYFSDSNRQFLLGFIFLGLFILLLACINYINMATSRAGNRVREIGMKKVLGAQKRQLVGQFLTESLIFSFIAMILGFILAELVLSLTSFNDLIGKNLQIDLAHNHLLLIGSLFITFLVGILSGAYPSFYLSHLAPVSSLKGEMRRGRKGYFFRNALITFQFTISIAAVILTISIQKQIKFMRNLDLGFDQENVLVIASTNSEIQDRFPIFRNMIIDYHNVISAGFSNSSLGYGLTGYAFDWETQNGEMEEHATRQLYADRNYLETMGIQLITGTNFMQERSADATSIDFIVNEAMVDLFGWTEPIGKKNRFGQVIGVVKNFNFASARDQITPLYILQSSRPLGVLNIRLKGEDLHQTMEFIKKQWQIFAPDVPMNYSFLQDNLNALYKADDIDRKLAGIFSFFCILISCSGLFGLTSFITIQRTKEVAVRKILGSSVLQIIRTLFKNIFFIIILAAAFAIPLAIFIFGWWQNNYANKYPIEPGIFVFTFIGAILISFLTSAYHTIKVANTNPVKALKYE
ncbi:MAG TPA: ABC transporter permease [Candidatus Cloacimonadota bacterium]|nr:ABC transporter permease [Candidatus Cloacimonadota bacterium]